MGKAGASEDRRAGNIARTATHICVDADSTQSKDPGNIALSGACRCFDHEESLRALPQDTEAGHDERLGTAD